MATYFKKDIYFKHKLFLTVITDKFIYFVICRIVSSESLLPPGAVSGLASENRVILVKTLTVGIFINKSEIHGKEKL